MMNMELQEEIMVGMGINSNSNVVLDQTHIIAKGKRTKRQRPQSPAIVPMTTSSSSGVGNRGGGGGGCGSVVDRNVASPTTSIGYTGSTTEEEEDMANCLIMLAKGYVGGEDCVKQMAVAVADQEDDHHQVDEKFNSRKFTEAATTTGKAGFYVYECKTCNRCFPSFQALGGHRASHKKPKALQEAAEKKALQLVLTEDHEQQFLSSSSNLQIGNQNRSSNNNSLFSHSNNIINSSNNNKSKVHECSICGSEFSSGQALGGHMRRHRTTPVAASATTAIAANPVLAAESFHHQHQEPMINKKQRNVLSLDLNLPAPEEDHREAQKFSFATTKQNLVFSASALVDCHY